MTEFVSAVPIIPARDIEASAAWYRDELGFEVFHVEQRVRDRRPRRVVDPLLGAERHPAGGVQHHDPARRARHRRAVRALPKRDIVHPNAPLEEQPWGFREFAVIDHDGNLVTFFEPPQDYDPREDRRDPPGPHQLREHGAGLLPARARRRGGDRRPHRAEPDAGRGRARARAHLVDRVRASRRPPAAPAAPLRLVRGGGRLDPARDAHAARPSARSPSRRRAPPPSCSTKVLLPQAEHVPLGEDGRRDAPDRRRRAPERVRGSDAAPRPRPPVARAHRAADGVRRLGGARPVADGLRDLEHALVASVRMARAEPELLAHEASARYGYPAGFLARYFEKLRYSFGPRERAGLYTFLEMARDVGELDHVPELRFVSETAVDAASASTPEATPRAGTSSTRRSDAPRRAHHRRGRRGALLRPRELLAVGARRERGAQPAQRSAACHVHRRPEHQLHERLLHGLRLLRLLPPPRRHARGVPAAEDGHLQEDRGDGRDRRHRRSSCRAATTPTSASTGTRTCFRSIKARYPSSTCTRSRPPRSSTSRGARS